jgi:prepilin-type N-terminal cleavage/methylation domain-containing protein
MNRPFHKSGMTLIELLVVLALLAGLASIAVRTASTLNRSGRVDQTSALFDSLQEVVAGDGLNAGRFLRDLGRLPIIQSDTEGEELSELWLEPDDIAYGTVTTNVTWDPDYSDDLPEEITLRCGWNGPYVLVTDPATQKLYDGYGNAFIVSNNAAQEIVAITSYGADGAEGAGESWADEDSALDWGSTVPDTELTVTIGSTNAWDDLHVLLFSPNVTASTKQIVATSTNLINQTTCTFTDQAPTQCRLCAYGTAGTNTYTSGTAAKALLLEPGQNFITLYLKKID